MQLLTGGNCVCSILHLFLYDEPIQSLIREIYCFQRRVQLHAYGSTRMKQLRALDGEVAALFYLWLVGGGGVKIGL